MSDRNNFDNQVDSYLSFLKNEYVAAALSLFLIVYAGVIAPKLSPNVLALFDNWIVQVAMFFAIVYISKQNATLALITAVAVLVTLMIVNSRVSIKIQSPTANGAEHFCAVKNRMSKPGYDLPPSCDNMYGVMNSGKCMSSFAKTQNDNVDGIMDESIEDIDRHMAGFRNAVVQGGAITSKGGPLMLPHYEPEAIAQEQEQAQEQAQAQAQAQAQTEKEEPSSLIENEEEVVGIEESQMENEVVGSTLDEDAEMIGSENASTDHEIMNAPSETEEVAKVLSEGIEPEVENIIGKSLTHDDRKSIIKSVKHELANMMENGERITPQDIVRICRETHNKIS